MDVYCVWMVVVGERFKFFLVWGGSVGLRFVWALCGELYFECIYVCF